jgi:RNA polymerase sigma-70 factor (ECF subfamily)
MRSHQEDLITRARHFDLQALGEIYDAYSNGLYAYGWRLLGDTVLAEECVAETFARFLEALRRGKGPHSHLQAYLYRIAHNWITDYYRRHQALDEPLEEDFRSQTVGSLEDQVAERLWKKEVREALARLTPDQRQVLTLLYLEGWEKEDVAAALGKPAGAVKALQHRGINALRRILKWSTEDAAAESIRQYARSAT